jgi:hypothetical protein
VGRLAARGRGGSLLEEKEDMEYMEVAPHHYPNAVAVTVHNMHAAATS